MTTEQETLIEQLNAERNITRALVSSLTKEQTAILKVWLDRDSDYCYPYITFEKSTGLDRKVLQANMKVLRDMGLVYYARGLMDEEGQVAGSGHGIEHHAYQAINELFQPEIERKNEIESLLYYLRTDHEDGVKRLTDFIDKENAAKLEKFINKLIELDAFDEDFEVKTLVHIIRDL